ncbi:MAG: lactonase family protein [Acidobacteriia bacterium]|nr:lactonase family protein [Terriglobia bacterium]
MSPAGFAQTTGAVYINGNTAANEVWAYTRAADGTLTFAGTYSTQGSGSALSSVNSQGGIVLSPNGKALFVVNNISNDITMFAVTGPGQLTFLQRVSSGGQYPVSLAVFRNVLYVLNARVSANITAFKFSRTGMTPIAGSTLPLSTGLPNPAQISFSPSGKLLVVAEISTSKLDTYTVAKTGLATGPQVQNSNGRGPFGFAFDNAGRLIVSEVTKSAMSSYAVSPSGALSVITGSLLDLGAAACWVVNTNNAAFPNQYSYVTNTASGTMSGYRINSDGSIALLNPDGITVDLGPTSDPIDMAVSADNNYLYTLEGTAQGIVGFQIQPDGSLVQVTSVSGSPTSSFGIAAN